MQFLRHWRHSHTGWQYSDTGTETEWIAACQWRWQCGDQPPEKCRCLFPRAPNVSTASGTKQYWSHNAVYFVHLRSSASTATVQAAIDARCMWLMARVSGHVMFHTKHLVCDHGTRVKPSGRLPSFHVRHEGSSPAGISTRECALYENTDGAV